MLRIVKNYIEEQKSTFIHLIYEYRCLATATYAWNQYGDRKTSNDKKLEANKLIPEIGTIIQDSILLHTRCLIDFFIKIEKNKSDKDTDLQISTFLKVSQENIEEYKKKISYEQLKQLKKQIEVHVLHLTDWRDPNYRNDYNQEETNRPDWDEINFKIFPELLKVLKDIASYLDEPWKLIFFKLYDASKKRFEQGSNYNWPDELQPDKFNINLFQ